MMHTLFGVPRVLIGMLHVPPLPGSPSSRGEWDLNTTVARVVEEARIYRDGGFHALMIENMHDRPYLPGSVGPETVAAMTVIGHEVHRAVPLPLGVQVLAAANHEAVAVAMACGASFVRVEGFVFAHVADEGLIQGNAGDLLRYRARIGADRVKVFADIKKKHASHALTADVSLVDTAESAEFFLADGVVVTGPATGRAADPEQVRCVAQAVRIPTLVGSGVTPQTIGDFPLADGFIVGSAVKHDGHWTQAVDPRRVAEMAAAFAQHGQT